MPGGVITRANMPALHERGIADVFFNEYELYDQGLVEQWFNMMSSVKELETDVVVAGMGQALPIGEGGEPTYDAIEQAWTVVFRHGAWGLAMEATHESIMDNLYIQLLKAGAKELGKAQAYTRQVQAWGPYNDASNVYIYNGTGYPILSTAHPRVDGGTRLNRRAVDVVLSQEGLEDAIQAWAQEMVDLRGRKQIMQPELLMHGSSDRFKVARLLRSAQRTESADNDINPLHDVDLKPFHNPHLTDDHRFFMRGPKRANGAKFYDREKVLFKNVDSQSNWNVRKMTYQRFISGVFHPEGTWGSF